MLTQGIEVWWPEEGDRRKGATAERAGRWDEEEAGYDRRVPQRGKISGCYLGGPSAAPERNVRRQGVTILPP